MKKNLALILALVMLMGTIFSVLPVAAAAEATASASYEPTISYANINYSDKMYMMFAVPAPAALDSGDEFKLIIWHGVKSEVYSYHDSDRTVLAHEAETVDIGGKQYYVFKYDIAPAEMTSVIAARPVVLNNWDEYETVVVTPAVTDEAGEVITPAVTEEKFVASHTDVVMYGDVIEYSVLEYVATAKGEFGGTALADDVLATLDALLAFGAVAQDYASGEYDFYPNDELSKIWYTPVIDGVKGDKIFGGFFKKGSEFATLSAPHFDDYAFDAYLDANGEAVVDADGFVDNGVQVVAPAEGDIEIIATYNINIMMAANPNNSKVGRVTFNRYDTGSGNNFDKNIGGLAYQAGSGPDGEDEDFIYFGLSVVQDPYSADPAENTYRIAANTSYQLALGNSTNDWKFSMKPSAIPGFGDTVTAIATIDFTIARGPDGEMPPTGRISLRSNTNKNYSIIGNFNKDGYFLLRNDDPTTTDIVENTVCPTPVAENGYTRYCLIIDFANEVVYVYASNESGELVYQAHSSSIQHFGTHLGVDWLDFAKTLDRIEFMGDRFAGVRMTDEEKESLADLDGDGIGETPMYTIKEDGKTKEINKAAVEWFHNQYRSFYMKEFKSYVGSPVEVLPQTFEMYDIDANSATTDTKNSQLYFKNFGDEELVSQIKLPAGTTFGGIGINTSDPNSASLNPFNQDNLALNYAGVDVIDDPYQAGNKVYSFNGNIGAVLWQAENIKTAGTRPAYTQALKINSRAKGFFDGSIVPVITYDMTVGGNGYDRMLETDTIRFRGASNVFVHLFKIAADGSILVCKPNEAYTDAIFVDTGADVSKNGYTRIVAEVDCANEQFRLYAGDEGKVLECVATIDTLWITSTALSHNVEGSATKPKTFATWMEMANALDRTEILIESHGINELTAEELAAYETIDAAAAQALYRQCRALLIKDWDTYLGRAAR